MEKKSSTETWGGKYNNNANTTDQPSATVSSDGIGWNGALTWLSSCVAEQRKRTNKGDHIYLHVLSVSPHTGDCFSFAQLHSQKPTKTSMLAWMHVGRCPKTTLDSGGFIALWRLVKGEKKKNPNPHRRVETIPDRWCMSDIREMTCIRNFHILSWNHSH